LIVSEINCSNWSSSTNSTMTSIMLTLRIRWGRLITETS
jgi:hypothetical protein